MKNKIKEVKQKNKKIIVLVILMAFLIASLVGNALLLYSNYNNKKHSMENIIFFGDSITNGYQLEKFFTNSYIINKGIPGNKTEDLIKRLDKDVYEYNPSKVVILIGINDIRRGIKEDDILFNIQTIINGIKTNRNQSKIYIESIYPVNENILAEKNQYSVDNLKNETVKKVNESIKTICKDNNIEYIDLYDSLLDDKNNLDELYTYDGLHLNTLGYLKVTSVLRDKVTK